MSLEKVSSMVQWTNVSSQIEFSLKCSSGNIAVSLCKFPGAFKPEFVHFQNEDDTTPVYLIIWNGLKISIVPEWFPRILRLRTCWKIVKIYTVKKYSSSMRE